MTVHSDGNSSARPDVHEIIERGVAMTNRVVENARAARRYWASWEACNDRLKEGSSMRDALRWHTPSGFGEIRDATATAAILATLRVSEHPQRNTQSACAISGILWNEAAVEVLTSHDWWDRTAIASAIVEYEITQQPNSTTMGLAIVISGTQLSGVVKTLPTVAHTHTQPFTAINLNQG